MGTHRMSLSDNKGTFLNDVRRAARAKSRADARYKQTLQDAVAAGASHAQIGRELGLSRQAIRQQLERI
jgi:DNA-binding CsgD family transcriptional regulator